MASSFVGVVRRRRVVSSFLRPRTPSSIGTSLRYFSDASLDNKERQVGDDDETIAHQQQQPFVETRIRPGEWDPFMTNPLYRPKYKSRAKIISAEDFANRPRVGMSTDFESFEDAMVTLSWLDQSEQKEIYQLYVNLMEHAKEQHGRTSHEYVMRFIAQKFNLTAERVAAYVQLQHNEEQIRKNEPDRKLLTEAADYMDELIKNEIRNAYETFNQKQPDHFVEDPVGVNGAKPPKTWTVVEDLFDMDQMWKDTLIREEEKARLMIDGHRYLEDTDDEDIPIPIDKDCKSLMRQQHKFVQEQEQKEEQTTPPPAPGLAWPTSAEGKTRPRWKFVAQTINTRELRKQKSQISRRIKRGAKNSSYRSYVNNSPENTLVEQDGQLRAATMADIRHVSWKPRPNVLEHTYSEAKKGWLDRTRRGQMNAWGSGPREERPPVDLDLWLAGVDDDDDDDEGEEEEGESSGNSSSSSDGDSGGEEEEEEEASSSESEEEEEALDDDEQSEWLEKEEDDKE